MAILALSVSVDAGLARQEPGALLVRSWWWSPTPRPDAPAGEGVSAPRQGSPQTPRSASAGAVLGRADRGHGLRPGVGGVGAGDAGLGGEHRVVGAADEGHGRETAVEAVGRGSRPGAQDHRAAVEHLRRERPGLRAVAGAGRLHAQGAHPHDRPTVGQARVEGDRVDHRLHHHPLPHRRGRRAAQHGGRIGCRHGGHHGPAQGHQGEHGGRGAHGDGDPEDEARERGTGHAVIVTDRDR